MSMKTLWLKFLNWIAPEGCEDETGWHPGPEPNQPRRLLLLISILVLISGRLPASAQTNALIVPSPSQQHFAFMPSPNKTPSYVFYIGTNAGTYLNRVALTNATWTAATNELTVGIAKTNLFAGLTNYVTATAMDANGVESIPCNEINFVPPRPPGTLRLSVELLRSTEPDGPWETLTSLPPVEVAALAPRQFFRTRTTITP